MIADRYIHHRDITISLAKFDLKKSSQTYQFEFGRCLYNNASKIYALPSVITGYLRGAKCVVKSLITHPMNYNMSGKTVKPVSRDIIPQDPKG